MFDHIFKLKIAENFFFFKLYNFFLFLSSIVQGRSHNSITSKKSNNVFQFILFILLQLPIGLTNRGKDVNHPVVEM